ncbi:MAG: hypothetical protein Kow0031_10170 [Anaerolineae bacterium]
MATQTTLKSLLIAALLGLTLLVGFTPSPAAAQSGTPDTAAAALSEADADGIRFMREEEKLARDVYLTLFDEWGLRIFQNIARSEQMHMDAVATLIDRYGLTDPARPEIGVFTNPDLQQLYDDLVAQGSQSLEDALLVGAAIEEIDILDLQLRLNQTSQADIQIVYNSLMKGSRNHLRAFTSTWQRQTGETYQPQYLDPATYDDIVSSPRETGNGNRGGQQGRGQGQRGRR